MINDSKVSPDNVVIKFKLSELKQISQVHVEIVESLICMGGEAKYSSIREQNDIHSSNMSKRSKFLEELGLVDRLPDEGEAGKSLKMNDEKYDVIGKD